MLNYGNQEQVNVLEYIDWLLKHSLKIQIILNKLIIKMKILQTIVLIRFNSFHIIGVREEEIDGCVDNVVRLFNDYLKDDFDVILDNL